MCSHASVPLPTQPPPPPTFGLTPLRCPHACNGQVHLLAPTRIVNVIEGTRETRRRDTYELMLVSTDLKDHTVDVKARIANTLAVTGSTYFQFASSFHGLVPRTEEGKGVIPLPTDSQGKGVKVAFTATAVFVLQIESKHSTDSMSAHLVTAILRTATMHSPYPNPITAVIVMEQRNTPLAYQQGLAKGRDCPTGCRKTTAPGLHCMACGAKGSPAFVRTGWHTLPGWGEKLAGQTVATCSTACCARSWCKSFNMYSNSSACYLKATKSGDAHLVYSKTGNYYEQRGQCLRTHLDMQQVPWVTATAAIACTQCKGCVVRLCFCARAVYVGFFFSKLKKSR